MEKGNVAPELVRQQLHTILSYHELKNSQVLSRFLAFVVEKKLNGREDEIKEYTIGVRALGRPADFNPQLDAIVRIHAGRLRRLINDYYLKKGMNDPVLITIPKGTYVPAFSLHTPGQPITSQDAETLAGEHSSGTNGTPFTSNGHDTADKYAPNKPVMAVFPFHNFSSDNSRDYFIRGMGEQLSIDLARFQNISVLSYYSTSKYHEETTDLKKLHKTLALDYVLTGSVRFEKEMIRMNVQLILTNNSEIVWAETYLHHFTADNLFDIQQDITDQLLNVIAGDNGILMQRNIGKASPVKRTTMDVQEAIYRYYDFVKDFAAEKHEKTLSALEKATQNEKGNALILAMLADLHIHTYVNSIETLDTLLKKAEDMAQKAVKLDAFCQHAQKTMTWCYLLGAKKKEAIDAAERCMVLNPKAASMVASMGLGLVCLGEYTKGFNYLVKSMHLNPELPPGVKLGFAIYYFNKKNYLESMQWMEKFNMFDAPLFALFTISLRGKIFKKKLDYQPDNVVKLKDKADQIISHLIIDPKIKTEIFDGLKLAGLAVK